MEPNRTYLTWFVPSQKTIYQWPPWWQHFGSDGGGVSSKGKEYVSDFFLLLKQYSDFFPHL